MNSNGACTDGGTTATACGTFGESCEACTNGATCSNGDCVGGSCPGGCFGGSSGLECQPGTHVTECGNDGGSCSFCFSNEACVNGSCVAQTPTCTAQNQQCTSSGQCCSLSCSSGLCVADAGTTCSANGVSCFSGSQCCSQFCNSSTGTCAIQPSCLADFSGSFCSGNTQCCSRACSNGTCVPDAGSTCNGNGTFCSNNTAPNCCSGYCNPSQQCATAPSCRPTGGSCGFSSQCCSRSCSQGTGAGTGTCLSDAGTASCTATNNFCASSAECCSLSCSSGFCVADAGTSSNSYLISNSTQGYIDACTGGTTVLISADDSYSTASLPFDFPFWGQTMSAASTVYLHSNGYLSFDSAVVDYGPLGDTATPNSVVAPYWADLQTGTSGVCYRTLGTAPSRQFVVEWRNAQFYMGTANSLSFELVLSETTGNVDFIYTLVSGSADIGLEDSTGANFVEHTTGVTGGSAIRFTPFP